ncbi:helicase-related protein [Legionella tunisiensis]|uniref:helicase-related protein n=1 Tax=Legionella tunisiensis TaxID=1034944 RepID=UPI0002E60E6C|nr:helicase-related protein [Legionella tunisiensis]
MRKKSTATSICERAVECIKRNIPLPTPLEFSNQEEVKLLYNLYVKNIGSEAPATISAKHGIFTHHNNTPHGIRLSVEHAMRKNLVRFVICTSTLAQGVNLPIRYLIITSVYQGMERIKIRDFHNLIGRAGRAGMHTEGSILFTDPTVYDKN